MPSTRIFCLPASAASAAADMDGAAITSTNCRPTMDRGGFLVELAIEGDDAAERGGRIGAVGAVIGVEQ